jgi:hypothetical protein
MEEIPTTAPPPPSSMSGTAARVRAWAVATFQENSRIIRSGDVSRNGRGMVPPTLLTTTSTRPSSALAMPASEATASRSLRSAGTTTARRPAASTSAATASSWAWVRDESTTSAPAWASAMAEAAPIPRPAPVTMATLSSRRKRSWIMAGHPSDPDENPP